MFYFNLTILSVGVICSIAYADAVNERLDDDLVMRNMVYQSWEHSQDIVKDTYSNHFVKCEGRCNYKTDVANLICNYMPRPAYIHIACFVYILANFGYWVANFFNGLTETIISWRRLKALVNANDHSPYAKKEAIYPEQLWLSKPLLSIEDIDVQKTKANDVESQIIQV